MKEQEFSEKTVTRNQIFSGKIIDLVVADVLLPNGLMAKRELVYHRGAVGILALTADSKIVLVRQFRKPLEKVILEIPAGIIDEADQGTEATAKRELEEETGLRGRRFKFLLEFATSPGFANELIYLYEAKELEKVANPLPQDADELIEVHYLTLGQAKQAILQGDIYDAKTILAIQYWELSLLQTKAGLEEER